MKPKAKQKSVKTTTPVKPVKVTKTPEVKTPEIPVPTPVEAKIPEVKIVTAKKLSFIEAIISGLETKSVGERTLYIGENNLKLEIVDGKLMNRGLLRKGWNIRLSGGDKGVLVHVDESRAMVHFTSGADSSISTHSEVEIIDPAQTKLDNEEKKKLAEAEKAEKAETSGKPTSQQYAFDGKSYSKSFLARAIVEKYMNDNPKTTLKQLEAKFPAPFMGRFGLFKEAKEAKKISGNGLSRYFFKPEQLIKVGSDSIAVCNQITHDKIVAIIEIAKTLGYTDIKQN